MPDLSSFDLKTLAGWAALIAYAIYHERNTIKAAIAHYYRDKQLDATDRREANQDILASRVDSELQEKATKASREWADQAFSHSLAKDLIHEMLEWAKTDFSKMQDKIDGLEKEVGEQGKAIEKAINVQSRQIELNSQKITGLNSIISQLVDRRREN